LAAAWESPEWRSRQQATWITDHLRLSVGGSTVYRLLKREGLVKPPEMKLLAGKEYQRKTSGPHQMWVTDASYFRVVGLLLHAHRDGRLLPVHPGLEAATGHDI